MVNIFSWLLKHLYVFSRSISLPNLWVKDFILLAPLLSVLSAPLLKNNQHLRLWPESWIESLRGDRREWNPRFPGLRPDLCSCTVCTGFACNAWVTFTVEKHCENASSIFYIILNDMQGTTRLQKGQIQSPYWGFFNKDNFSCLRTIEGNNHGSGLPREVVQSASLEVSNTRLGRVLGNLVWLCLTLL